MRLVGDIGGTNARFAIAEHGHHPVEVRKMPVAQYTGLIEAAQEYLLGRPHIKEAVLAVAAPVVGDQIKFTNNSWGFSIDEIRHRLGVGRLVVINDLVAHAWSLAALDAHEVASLKTGMPEPAQPIAVIAPGTGLGVSFLVKAGGALAGLPSEAGHASFSPQDAVQVEILRELRDRYEHVSAERLVSGPGLLAIAKALARIRGEAVEFHEPRDVSAGAADGNPLCREALRTFSSALGSTAGNLALTLLTGGGVIVTGGLCRALRPLLDLPALTAGFTGKGRFTPYLKNIPIDQILRAHAALLGAAVYPIHT